MELRLGQVVLRVHRTCLGQSLFLYHSGISESVRTLKLVVQLAQRALASHDSWLEYASHFTDQCPTCDYDTQYGCYRMRLRNEMLNTGSRRLNYEVLHLQLIRSHLQLDLVLNGI